MKTKANAKKKEIEKNRNEAGRMVATGEESLIPPVERVFAAMGSLEDAGDVTGRGVEVAESSMGGATTCIVCFTGEKTHLAVPCAHQKVCGTCSKRIDACPVCRVRLA